ncbi:MAG: 3-dehydroquinate synthase [Deltaproteobacteria bacterium]|nr:3-dehydroquinate synthase [Deltaproteobacteria bacterium]
MTRLVVDLGARSYPIWIGEGLLVRAGHLLGDLVGRRRVAVITTPVVRRLHGAALERSLRQAGCELHVLLVPDGERHKTLGSAARLYDQLLARGLERGSPIVAFGGGVIGDLAGFVAATYLRGVPFVQVPTTLLAQVDASVGGKVAVNHPRGKNLIGVFYQPRAVLSDVGVLRTLPRRELAAGLAEVIKCGVIRDAGLFRFVERQAPAILAGDPRWLGTVIRRACAIKAAVVTRDEREEGLRRILNFGHTVGHAVEQLTGYRRYLHGEAVAMGMVAAARLSAALGLCPPAVGERLARLLRQCGLPVELPRLRPAGLLAALEVDKKMGEGYLYAILPEAVGRVVVKPLRAREVVSRLLDRHAA